MKHEVLIDDGTICKMTVASDGRDPIVDIARLQNSLLRLAELGLVGGGKRSNTPRLTIKGKKLVV